LKQE